MTVGNVILAGAHGASTGSVAVMMTLNPRIITPSLFPLSPIEIVHVPKGDVLSNVAIWTSQAGLYVPELGIDAASILVAVPLFIKVCVSTLQLAIVALGQLFHELPYVAVLKRATLTHPGDFAKKVFSLG
jgi:hypothetical protein